jgi:transposase
MPCKHVFAARYTIEREYSDDGSITEIKTLVLQEKRKTYPQDWRAYNSAQTREKAMFQSLLRDLCAGIEDRMPGRGRPRLPLGDGVFCACFKVFSMLSSRRFTSDLHDAHDKGYISRVPHFNSVLNVLDSEETTPILTALVSQSAAPLAAIETNFAVDSTGFSGCRFDRWFEDRWGTAEPKSHRAWVKAHAMIGCLTNVVTAVQVLEKYSGDCPTLQPLMRTTMQQFKIHDVCADAAYLSLENYESVAAAGAKPFIAFKTNTVGNHPGAWNTAFHFYSLNREEFLKRYHQRSNIESTFSAIKRKFGDSVRAKNNTSMVNECLAKFVCHNICCLIQSMEEFGIDVKFTCTKTLALAQNTVGA